MSLSSHIMNDVLDRLPKSEGVETGGDAIMTIFDSFQ